MVKPSRRGLDLGPGPAGGTVFLASCAALYLLALRAYYVGYFNDDAFYILGARALLHGRYSIPYMPGYPLLLSPLVWAFPRSFLPCQLFSIALTLGALALFWRYLSDVAPGARAAATALAALNPLTVSMSGVVLSDVPFLCLTGLLLVAARNAWPSNSPRRWASLAALSSCAFYLRPTGLAFPLALTGTLALRRRFKLAALAASVSMTVVLPYLLAARSQPGIFLYPQELADPYRGAGLAALAQGAWRNLAFYSGEIFARTMFRWPARLPGGSAAGALATAAGLFFVAAGALRWADGFSLLYLAIYAGAHLLWSKQAGRYLLPVLPLVFALFFSGAGRFGRRAPRWALALSLLSCLAPLGSILRASLALRTPVNTPPERTLVWLRVHVEPDAVLAAELDGRVQLLTGRRCVHLPRAHNEGLANELRRRGARYVLVAPNDGVLRTASGNSPQDPVPVARLERELASAAAVRVFDDAQEGTAVYRLE